MDIRIRVESRRAGVPVPRSATLDTDILGRQLAANRNTFVFRADNLQLVAAQTEPSDNHCP